MNFLKRKRVLIPLFIVILLFAFNSCVTFRKSDKKVYAEFKKQNITPTIYREKFEEKTIRYISTKPIDKNIPTIIFVHGAPGSGDNFFKHLQDKDLSAKANLITVDRLGYGYSDYGNSETSIDKQAESIYTIIQKHNLKNVILFSWSFGGPIVGKMAVKYPEVKNIFMIAPAISPADEKFFGIGKLVHWKSTRWLFSKALRVSDDEKSTHVDELTKMKNDWKEIKIPIHYYHGTKDWIVPYENMAFIKKYANDKLLIVKTIDKGGHMIVFNNYDMIKEDLLEVVRILE